MGRLSPRNRCRPPESTGVLADLTQSPGLFRFSRFLSGVIWGNRIRVGGIRVSSKGPVDFVAAHLTFAPGGTTGWHVHPGPVLVIVKTGTVTKYSADCTVNRYTAGQAFVERGPTDVNMVRNETTTTAETLVTFIIPVGVPPIHSVPAPPDCNH